MVTAYSPILKLALPVQGELSGTWGDVVNDNITSMVEQAIAGRAVIDTWTTNSHVLTTANGTTSESRCAMLEFTDTGTALSGAGTVTCPTLSKIYIAKNASGQNVTLKTSGGTGILVPNGRTMFLFCDGTNVVEAVTSTTSLQLGTSTIVTAVLDEDNMASDSATSLATQQSIKAYVDSQVGANNELSEVLANGNTSGANDIIMTSGQKITTNTIDETTAASGVTIDSVLLKDDGVNATNLEITNIKANDGTAAGSIADSTGVVTVLSSILTTADINGGTADGVIIGGTTPAAATVTNLIANTDLIIAGTTTITAVLDEDNMASDSATALATQQSIKAYVDSQVGTVDTLAEILAIGNTTGGTDIVASTTDKVQFRDAAIYINSSVDGQLDIVADTEIQIAATTVDVNGALDVSGTALVTGVLTTTAATVHTGGITMPDNAKAIFGDSSDLEIYHDGTQSFISEQGPSSLNILSSQVALNNPANTENMLTAVESGAVTLFHNNAAKLATTATGIDVTGTATMDGLVVSAPSGDTPASIVTTTAGSFLEFTDVNTTAGRSPLVGAITDGLAFYTSAGSYSAKMTITASGNVGIGTSTPSSFYSAADNLVIGTGSGAHGLTIYSGSGDSGYIGFNDTVTNGMQGFIEYNHSGDYMAFAPNGSEKVRIDSSGNLIIANTGGTLYTTTSGTSNFRAGVNAGNSILSGGSYNTVVGDEAGTAITTGDGMVAIGYQALMTEDTQGYSTAVGSGALKMQNTGSSAFNVAVGHEAGVAVSTGVQNTLVGTYAGHDLNTGSYNVAIGVNALSLGTSSGSTVAIGYVAGKTLATANNNTIIGSQAGEIRTGAGNTIVGQYAGRDGTDGTDNTFIGRNSGYTITTGSKNSILGMYNGNYGGLDIRTSSNNIVLSDGDGNPRLHIDVNNNISSPSFFAGAAAYSGDLNDLKKTGFYRSENTNSNNPSFGYYAVVVYGNQGNVTSQIATELAETTTYVRSFNTSWTAWARLDT
jgi:hypothetical protein